MVRFLAVVTLVLLAGFPSFAADKVDLPAQIAAAKVSIENIAVKVGNYPKALNEIEKARQSLKKAEQAYDKGQKWMGLGSLKPEAELEVRHNLQMVDLATSLATSRATKGRNDEESATLEKQILMVKGRVKLLEDRKAEDDRLRQTAQNYEVTSKELASIKADQAKLDSQLDQLTADKKKLEAQVTTLTEEKTALAVQIDSLKKATVPSIPAPAVVAPVPATGK